MVRVSSASGGCRRRLRASARLLRARPRSPSTCASRCARSPALSTTQVATVAAFLVGGLQRHPALGVVARDAPRLEPVEPQLARRLDDDHRAVLEARASTRRAAARRARRSPSAGAAATWRRNSSPIAGCVIASSSLRVSSSTNASLGERGPVERAVGREDVGPEPLDELGERRASPARPPRRAIASASMTTAPRAASMRGHGRLPRPDPAREPDHQHGGGVYARSRCTSSGRATKVHSR